MVWGQSELYQTILRSSNPVVLGAEFASNEKPYFPEMDASGKVPIDAEFLLHRSVEGVKESDLSSPLYSDDEKYIELGHFLQGEIFGFYKGTTGLAVWGWDKDQGPATRQISTMSGVLGSMLGDRSIRRDAVETEAYIDSIYKSLTLSRKQLEELWIEYKVYSDSWYRGNPNSLREHAENDGIFVFSENVVVYLPIDLQVAYDGMVISHKRGYIVVDVYGADGPMSLDP